MLGQRIKELRIKKNIHQGELAKAVGISQQAMSKIENNKMEPTLKTKEKIAAYFGLDVGDLYKPDDLDKIRKFVLDAVEEKYNREIQSR